MGKKISCLPGDTSLVKELVEHLLQFTGEGLNLDCLHPAQYVLDCLCGPHKGQFATQLENWYESYADFRGIKPKAFQATSCSAGNSGAIYHHPNSFLSIQCQQFDFYWRDVRWALMNIFVKPLWSLHAWGHQRQQRQWRDLEAPLGVTEVVWLTLMVCPLSAWSNSWTWESIKHIWSESDCKLNIKLRYDVPEDGLPSIDDWVTTCTSMLLDGLDLQREPLDVCARSPVLVICHSKSFASLLTQGFYLLPQWFSPTRSP